MLNRKQNHYIYLISCCILTNQKSKEKKSEGCARKLFKKVVLNFYKVIVAGEATGQGGVPPLLASPTAFIGISFFLNML